MKPPCSICFRSALYFTVAIVWMVMGCKGGLNAPGDSLQKVMATKIPGKEIFVAEDYDKRQPLSVAILPFDNQTKEPEAARLLRKLFYNNFSSLAYQDIEFSKIDATLPQFDASAAFETPDAAKIGPLLKADAVIVGRVTKFETLYAGVYASFSVAFELKMITSKENEVIWSVAHEETQRSGKVPLSPIGAIIAAASTAMDLSRYNMINTSNKLCQLSIDTIPPSVNLKGQSYPRISTLVHDGANRILKKGDQLQVGIEGSPGLNAQFVITPRDTPVAMQEKENGSYVGVYIVREGDELSDGQIVVTLTDAWNNTCRWEDTLGMVNLDGVPPDAPTGVKAAAGDKQISLRWNEGKAKDLAGYQVLRSQTPLSGYTEITFTEFTRFTDPKLTNDITYFYRVAAKDKAGNISQLTNTIPATPVPPGPTMVSGELGPETVWHPGGNPYFLDQEVLLPKGSRLRIEPGVVIKAAETVRFLIQGEITVNGEPSAPVLFSADHEGGTWEGIVFDHSEGESSLNHFEISEAITGIRIIESSPAISSGTIKQCADGVVVTGEKSAPLIKGITVYRNQKNGIVSLDLAQPRITTSKIAYNGAIGLELTRSAGKFLGNEISYNDIGVHLKQAPALLAANHIQFNTRLDLQSEESALEAIKIDLNFFGAPEEISALSSHPDHAKRGLNVMGTSEWRGPRQQISLKSFPSGQKPDSDQVLWIKGNKAPAMTASAQGKTPAANDAGKPDRAAAPAGESAQKEASAPAGTALDALIQGITLARKEAYPEAIVFLNQALKESFREAEVRFWLGFCHMQIGDAKEALQNYRQAVKLEPGNVEYLLHFGSALHLNDYPNKAKTVYQEVLRRDPKNQDAKTFLQLLEKTDS